jgi:hypothetical protein
MTKFIDENDMAIAMAVVSTTTMIIGFILGFTLSYIEKELVIGEVHEMLDRAIEKKFERDEYVVQLENRIVELRKTQEESETRTLKRRRVNTEESCHGDIEEPNIHLPPPSQPLERSIGRCVSEKED